MNKKKLAENSSWGFTYMVAPGGFAHYQQSTLLPAGREAEMATRGLSCARSLAPGGCCPAQGPSLAASVEAEGRRKPSQRRTLFQNTRVAGHCGRKLAHQQQQKLVSLDFGTPYCPDTAMFRDCVVVLRGVATTRYVNVTRVQQTGPIISQKCAMVQGVYQQHSLLWTKGRGCICRVNFHPGPGQSHHG